MRWSRRPRDGGVWSHTRAHPDMSSAPANVENDEATVARDSGGTVVLSREVQGGTMDTVLLGALEGEWTTAWRSCGHARMVCGLLDRFLQAQGWGPR
jgi:hypothetical protein